MLDLGKTNIAAKEAVSRWTGKSFAYIQTHTQSKPVILFANVSHVKHLYKGLKCINHPVKLVLHALILDFIIYQLFNIVACKVFLIALVS